MDRTARQRLVRAWLLTGVIDGLWAVVLTFTYQRPAARLWQGIAATVLGERAFDGGAATVLLGIVMHFGVAFAWSAVFLWSVMRSAWLRGVLISPLGVLKVAAVYGPLVWVVMSVVVIPLLVHHAVNMTYRWWIQAAGHVVFVGLPIVWGVWGAPVGARAPDAVSAR